MASRKEQREKARKEREQREAEERKKQRRKRRIWQVGSVLAIAVVAVVVVILISGSGDEDTTPTRDEAAETKALFAGVAMNGIELGNPDAPVTLYEFADLQCPFCRDFTESSFPQIVEKYVKPGRVKIVFRNLTFLGPDSVTAARAAAAASAQNKLWPFVDLFYKNQGPENAGYVTDAFIEDIASLAELDVEKLKADMSAPLVEQQLGEAQAQQDEYGINSTPDFLIQIGDGKPKPLGADSFEFPDMEKRLDAALKEAEGS